MQRNLIAKKPQCRKHDPVKTAVVYHRWLERVDPAEPLWRIPYFGQVVRNGAARKVAMSRWKEEDRKSLSNPKQVGLSAVLGRFSPDHVDNALLEHRVGPRSVVQAWANKRERELIAEHGGVLRDMNRRLKQTLNIQPGAKIGNPWPSQDAFRANAFHRFKSEMEAYIQAFGTSLVPGAYTSALTGYNLGIQLTNFRAGKMRDGMPNKKDIEAWAESLPAWTWSIRASALACFKEEMEVYVQAFGTSMVPRAYTSALTGYNLGTQLDNFRRGMLHIGKPHEKEVVEWAESLTGWTWNVADSKWDQFKSEMGMYVASNGTAAVPQSFRSSSGFKLGRVVHAIRSPRDCRFVNGNAERCAWLESLPGWCWDRHDQQWVAFQNELIFYVAAYGNAQVPYSYKASSGCKLGIAVSNIRKGASFLNGHDAKTRRAWLEALPGWCWHGKPGPRKQKKAKMAA